MTIKKTRRFEKSLLAVFVGPCGRHIFWKITVYSSYTALRAAKIWENHCLLLCSALRAAQFFLNVVLRIYEDLAKATNSFIWMHLSLMSMLERLVLKDLIQRTSQRVKWTSVARDMITFLNNVCCTDFIIKRMLERLVLKCLFQHDS